MISICRDKLNTLLINALVSTGELKEIEEYDVTLTISSLKRRSMDANRPTKSLGYRPGVYVIGDKIVYTEQRMVPHRMCVFIRQTPIRDSSLFWNPQNIQKIASRADCGFASRKSSVR